MKRPWTQAEDAIIRAHISEHGPGWDGWASLLPGRSKNAIAARKNKLGLDGPRAGGCYHGRCGGSRKAKGAGKAARSPRAPSVPWTDEQRVELVGCALAATEKCGHSLGECAVELARIIEERRRQRRKGSE